MVAYNFKTLHTSSIISGEKFTKVAECVSIEAIEIHTNRIEGIEIETDEFLSMEGLRIKRLKNLLIFLKNFGGATPMGRLGQPAKRASIYVQLAASHAIYATGQIYGSSGGAGQP